MSNSTHSGPWLRAPVWSLAALAFLPPLPNHSQSAAIHIQTGSTEPVSVVRVPISNHKLQFQIVFRIKTSFTESVAILQDQIKNQFHKTIISISRPIHKSQLVIHESRFTVCNSQIFYNLQLIHHIQTYSMLLVIVRSLK